VGAALLLAAGVARAGEVRVLSARVVAPNELRLRFSAPLPRGDAENFRLTTAQEPDIPIRCSRCARPPEPRVLTFAQRLMPAERYRSSWRTRRWRGTWRRRRGRCCCR